MRGAVHSLKDFAIGYAKIAQENKDINGAIVKLPPKERDAVFVDSKPNIHHRRRLNCVLAESEILVTLGGKEHTVLEMPHIMFMHE